MEMCYDGALVMPSSYAVMSEDEMTYVQGGSINTLKNNLYGLYGIIENYVCKWASGATVGRILAKAGMSWAQIGAMAGSYWKLAGKVVAIISSVTKWLGAHAFIVGVVGGVAAAALLWNVRVFY